MKTREKAYLSIGILFGLFFVVSTLSGASGAERSIAFACCFISLACFTML